MEQNPSLYLGENISIIDTKDYKGGFSTIFNAPNTKIIDQSEQTADLSVTNSATFNDIVINNVAAGIKDTDVANVSQINAEKNRATIAENNLITNLENEVKRATNVENQIIAKLDSLINNLENEVKRSTDYDETLTSSLNNEKQRAIIIENDLSTKIDSLTSRVDYLYNYFFKKNKG